MMEQVRGYGINGEQVCHAIPIESGLWHAIDFERTAGITTYTRQHLITRLADLIGGGHVWRLDIGDWRGDIDRAGNTWVGTEYLGPREYLPRFIAP